MQRDLKDSWKCVLSDSVIVVPSNAYKTQSVYPVVLHITRQERCSRLLVLLRPLMMIPHLVWALIYNVFVGLVLLISGPSILLFGKHPEALWDIVEGYFRYTVKVNAYALMMSDTFPPFGGGNDRPYPVRVHSIYPMRMSRWVLLLRPALVLPHLAVSGFFALYIIILLQFGALAALAAGRMPRWIWRQLAAFLLYFSRVNAYMLLLVDDYPPFNAMQPMAAEKFFGED